jgi:transposase
MFTLPCAVQVFICLQPTDLRKSFDSLAALVSNVVGQNPLSGHLFVFLNRYRNRVKILFWDRSGYCLYYKRLEAGTFRLPVQTEDRLVSQALSIPELTLMLEGIDLSAARRRKRFSLQQTA